MPKAHVVAVVATVVVITVPVITRRYRKTTAIGWPSPVTVAPEPPRSSVIPIAISPDIARARGMGPIRHYRWRSVAVPANADSN